MSLADSRESVNMAMDTLRTNKLRSGLTILGVVIGVATVIIISSIINGVNNKVQVWVDSLGTNVIWVFHMPVIAVAADGGDAGAQESSQLRRPRTWRSCLM